MELAVKRGRLGLEPADVVVLGQFEGEAALAGEAAELDKALSGLLSDVISEGEFRGKLLQVAMLPSRRAIPAKRVLLVGLGKRPEFALDRLRQAFGKAAKEVRDRGFRSLAAGLPGAEAGVLEPAAAAQAMTEGVLLGLYRLTRYKTAEAEELKEVEQFTIVAADEVAQRAAEQGSGRGRILAEAVNFTRDLTVLPANEATPSYLARTAEELARSDGLTVTILDVPQMRELKMGALLGVAQGSQQPPRFIVLEHEGGRPRDRPIVLVGKGITFDTGGISLKPAERMEEMRGDKAGACAVLGTMRAVAALSLPVRVVGLAPATENMPGGTAQRPGDIVTSLSGLTIEVINTDAEGRLILADALGYAARYDPECVIDLATLTGACVIALGHEVTGLFGNDPELMDRLRRAGEVTGERVWPMPLFDEYDEQIKSDFADVKNVGGRPAGAITAAAFLKKFAKAYRWAHLDIAGTSWMDKPRAYLPKGATGVGVRLLCQFLEDWVRDRGR
ncbi:MAG: leucyl aminopeptidase [Deltaproteobacteria bacterium]|nr:leucyl aminopeptidase [Deltaproteobacteria bacterium]